MAIQPIPTWFNGLLYRSRTEARWAVVFNYLGWISRYETEAFRLPSGVYIPDFYLPDIGVYFEVKGREATRLELKKAEDLCVANEKPVVISCGPPNHQRTEADNDLTIFYPEFFDDGTIAFQYDGGFVSGRAPHHPTCSLHLGNLSFRGSLHDVGWHAAFLSAANERFGVYPQER